MKLRSKQILFLFFIIAILVAPNVSLASGQTIDNIFITRETTIGNNFFQTGDMINISGTMKKDVIVFGQTVVIDGVIEGDLLGAANSLKINGEVKGNVRFIANELQVNAPVDKNLTVVANSLSINAPVGWGIWSYATTTNIMKAQTSDVSLYGDTMNIDSSIDGNLTLNVPNNGQLKFGKNVAIKGNFSYSDIKDVENIDSVQVGGIKERAIPFEIMPWKKQHNVAYVYGQLIYFLSLFLLGMVMLLVFRPIVRRIAESLLGSAIESFKWGVMYLILVPIAILLIALTIIGLPIAAIVLGFYILAIYISKVFVSLVLGAWLLKKNLKKDNLILALLLGTFAVVILVSAPYVGSILNLIVTIIGLGALVEVSREIIKEIK